MILKKGAGSSPHAQSRFWPILTHWYPFVINHQSSGGTVESNGELDPVGSTVRYEMMKLCTESGHYETVAVGK